MAGPTILFAMLSIAQTVLAAPLSMRAAYNDVASFNVTQNALDAQALNSIFGTLNANSSCSGQFESDMACVANNVAVCQGGKWQTLDECGQFQCLALPIMAGNGTTISCTNAAFADEIFAQLGVPGGFNATTIANMSTVTFPTFPSNSTSSSNSTDTSDDEGDDDGCDGEDGGSATNATATQTGTLAPTEAPATTITVPAASASAILRSISLEGGSIVTSIMPPAVSATASASVTPSPARLASSASVTASATTMSSKPVIALTAAGTKPTTYA